MQRRLDFKPGEKFDYANANYSLLAEVVKKVTRRSFDEYLHDALFAPLGMGSTGVYDQFTRYPIPECASPYLRVDGKYVVESISQSGILGSLGVVTNLDDMMKWNENFDHNSLEGGENLTSLMMKTWSLLDGRECWQFRGLCQAYSFGLFKTRYRGLDLVWHSGGTPGMYTLAQRYPKQKLSVVIFTNNSDYQPRLGELSEKIAEIYLGDEFTAPQVFQAPIPAASSPAPYLYSPAELSEYAGSYFSDELA